MTELVLEGGIQALTLRRIASGIGIAPSTLVTQFTDRARLVHWFCVTMAKRRTWRLDGSAGAGSMERLLPRDREGLDQESVWSAVCELGRTDESVGDIVQGHHAEVRHVVAYVLRVRAAQEGDLDDVGRVVAPDPDEVALLAALLEGLSAAMVRRLDPMPLAEATRLLHRQARATS